MQIFSLHSKMSQRNRFDWGMFQFGFLLDHFVNKGLTICFSPDGVTWSLLPAVDSVLTKRYEEWQHWLFAKGRAFEPFK